MAFRDILRGIGDLILNNKLITFLSVALFAFIIATIALAGENNSNADALEACRGQLWLATSVAPPAATTTPLPGDSTTGEASSTADASTTDGSSTESSTTEATTTTTTTLAPEGGSRKRRR